MVRLFHDAALEGVHYYLPGTDAAPAAPIPPPVVAAWAAAPYWSIEQPSRYLFEEAAQEHWGLDDFADLRLPAPVVLFEAPLSQQTKSAVVGTRQYGFTHGERYGVMLAMQPMPLDAAGAPPPGAAAGDLLLAMTLTQGRRGEPVLSVAAQLMLRLDARGRPLLWDDGGPTRLALSPGAVPGGAKAAARPDIASEVADTLYLGLWPACLVVDAVNAGRASLAKQALPAARRRALARTGRTWRGPEAVAVTPPPRSG